MPQIKYNEFYYNQTYFNGTSLLYKPAKRPQVSSIKFWQLNDGTLVGIFQGSKGDRADIDFIVKYLLPGEKNIRTPQNIHWVVDLLIKHEHHPIEVKEFLTFYHEWYLNATPFNSIEERNNYQFSTRNIIHERFESIAHDGTMSIEFIGILIELFSLNEKLSPRPVKMFEKLLKLFIGYCNGNKDYFQLISGSSAGY